MQRIIHILQTFRKKGDLVLLFLCLLTTGFGCVIIASATNYLGSSRFLTVQLAATILGVLCYVLLTSVDVEILAERREILFAIDAILILLLIPFGTDGGTGNRSWLDLPGFPVNIQPAEICKIIFTILLAKVMQVHQNHISSPRAVFPMAFHLVFLVGLNIAISGDTGVSLIFVFVFMVMAYVGGVKLWWFLAAFGAIAAIAPYFWANIMPDYQKNRILVIFDPTIDPDGLYERWHMKHSLLSLTGGGLTGQGLFNGSRTQVGALNAQHTDFIFSAIGEELGLLGCAFTLLLLAAVIFRVIYVSLRAPDYLSRLICVGIAAALIFQVCINVGMCLGLVPVIGLTLPFISYGGSSIVSMYLAMGIVSSIHAHPTPSTRSRYIQPPQ
ncbi:MAG: FtsW/RodA/SpoVE family cell cycle protein [Candidatus Faecousia sp.]|nr:FtsW/RodA/SpoVE family cell cycle protein [Clostridiales bacterium]MDD7650981.1 FtsW/RodA/SpoVE family cell cycle protein [Bacillota bacterium]MDY4218916.1 FtsW/RodA/SpoVE family cell cycle protein [Candidatus Faecousia sp.]